MFTHLPVPKQAVFLPDMRNDIIENTFFKLVRLAVGTDGETLVTLDAEGWENVLATARKQALVAVVLDGVAMLPRECKPPVSLMLQWIGMVQKIEIQNRRMNLMALKVCEKFAREGIDTVLLKGQGLAMLYPNPLHRMSGDIDLWIGGMRRSDVVSYVWARCPGEEVVYHHVDFPVLKDFEIELHFTPSWMNNYFVNRKVQKLFRHWWRPSMEHLVDLPVTEGSVAVPTPEMNRVYVLLHIYRHLFDEGIGLRQLLDYFYVLRSPCTPDERARTVAILRRLGMLRFARAVMYVEQVVFGLENEHLLLPPSERYGRRLLSEVMRAGNFGQFDERIHRKRNERPIQKFWRKVSRNVTFLTDYPGEVLWSPLFKIWHYFWRMRKGYLPRHKDGR